MKSRHSLFSLFRISLLSVAQAVTASRVLCTVLAASSLFLWDDQMVVSSAYSAILTGGLILLIILLVNSMKRIGEKIFSDMPSNIYSSMDPSRKDFNSYKNIRRQS